MEIPTVVRAIPKDEEFVQWHQKTTDNKERVLKGGVVVEFLIVKKQ